MLIQLGEASDNTLHAIAWQRLADQEIVVELVGPGNAIRDIFADLIRFAKTVDPGAGGAPYVAPVEA